MPRNPGPWKLARESGEQFYVDCKGVNRYAANGMRVDYYRHNPDHYTKHVRKRILNSFYGITLEDYNTLLDSQGFACAICREIPEDSEGKGLTLCVDHCHAENKVRALLCRPCNLGLGNFRDRVDLLLAAAKYLAS